jgi:ESS family glutamate:Na+ symporter
MELGNFGTNTLKPMLWGFNFLTGTLFGILFKNILKLFKRAKLMSREYINNYMLNRISGFCFDIMIVAGTAAINFEHFGKFLLPFILIVTSGAVATFIYVLWISKHLYPNYKYEGFFSMFGMLTGTASNGMILLREIDPKFETPAANNLVLQTLSAILLGFPVLLLVGYAPQSMKATFITLCVLIVFWALLTVFMLRTNLGEVAVIRRRLNQFTLPIHIESAVTHGHPFQFTLIQRNCHQRRTGPKKFSFLIPDPVDIIIGIQNRLFHPLGL